MKKKLDWKMGTVRWFDNFTGRGVITSNDGIDYQVHYSAIESDKKWKSLKSNSQVKFTSLNDSDFLVAEYVVERSK